MENFNFLNEVKIKAINGLTLFTDIFTQEYEDKIFEHIDKKEWNTTISRQTQHYGYNYPYKGSKRLLSADNSDIDGLYKFDGIIKELRDIIIEKFDYFCDQGIVNKYDSKTSIGAHTDNENLFDDKIFGFSILGPTIMRFKHISGDKKFIDVLLPRRSLIIMSGDARYMYTHEINKLPKRFITKNNIDEDKYCRISITFRKLK